MWQAAYEEGTVPLSVASDKDHQAFEAAGAKASALARANVFHDFTGRGRVCGHVPSTALRRLPAHPRSGWGARPVGRGFAERR